MLFSISPHSGRIFVRTLHTTLFFIIIFHSKSNIFFTHRRTGVKKNNKEKKTYFRKKNKHILSACKQEEINTVHTLQKIINYGRIRHAHTRRYFLRRNQLRARPPLTCCDLSSRCRFSLRVRCLSVRRPSSMAAPLDEPFLQPLDVDLSLAFVKWVTIVKTILLTPQSSRSACIAAHRPRYLVS